MFSTFVNSLAVLAICALVGIIGRMSKIINDQTDQSMSALIVNFTLPATIFAAMTMQPFSYQLLLESLTTLLIMAAIFFLGFFIATIIARLLKAKHSEKRIWQFSIMFPNVVYMGFPVISAVFGEEGMIHASMSAMIFNILVFTFGTYLIKNSLNERKKGNKTPITAHNIRKILFTPTLVAIYIGVVFFIFNIGLPTPISSAISLFGGMTTPLAMLLIGSLLAKYISQLGFVKMFGDWRIYVLALARLAAVPLSAYFTLMHLINPDTLGVIITLSAMPTAAITVVLTQNHKADTASALKIVVVSDIICLATIPLISLLFG